MNRRSFLEGDGLPQQAAVAHYANKAPLRRRASLKISKLISRLAKKIANKFHPERIILFGSCARGTAGPDSDIDLLVVMPVTGSVLDQSVAISETLPDLPLAVDITVTRPEDFRWRKDVVGTVEWPAAKEGKVLYVRA